jgi:hypothetical protein
MTHNVTGMPHKDRMAAELLQLSPLESKIQEDKVFLTLGQSPSQEICPKGAVEEEWFPDEESVRVREEMLETESKIQKICPSGREEDALYDTNKEHPLEKVELFRGDEVYIHGFPRLRY